MTEPEPFLPDDAWSQAIAHPGDPRPQVDIVHNPELGTIASITAPDGVVIATAADGAVWP
jgi:hypothetical protein